MDYRDRLVKLTRLLHRAGARLYEEGAILGYAIFTDSFHHTITNDSEGDWSEYPAAHAIFKFSELSDPYYLHLSAKIIKDEKAVYFAWSKTEVSKVPPKLSEFEEIVKKEYHIAYQDARTITTLVRMVTKKFKEESSKKK